MLADGGPSRIGEGGRHQVPEGSMVSGIRSRITLPCVPVVSSVPTDSESPSGSVSFASTEIVFVWPASVVAAIVAVLGARTPTLPPALMKLGVIALGNGDTFWMGMRPPIRP